MKKRIILGLTALGTALATLPLLAAFEAHIINVTAQIENALEVNTQPIAFGTVFPQEKLIQNFTVVLSNSFLDEARVDDVEYHIKQKDKPRDPADTQFCHENRPADIGDPDDPYYAKCYPSVCPYLSKLPDADPEPGNDIGIGAFHRPQCDDGIDNDGDGDGVDWPADPQCTSKYDDSESEAGQQGLVTGRLAKSEQDERDNWILDLDVPCFLGKCAQDWGHQGYELDPRLESQTFGCDLWVEVTGISEQD